MADGPADDNSEPVEEFPVSRAARARATLQREQAVEDEKEIDALFVDDIYEVVPNDYRRDIEWVYSRMGVGFKKGKVRPPSRPAAKMLRWANSDPDRFFRTYREYQKEKTTLDASPDRRDAIEDEKETMAHLRRLKKEITPDIEKLLRESAELFPEAFEATLESLGWSRKAVNESVKEENADDDENYVR